MFGCQRGSEPDQGGTERLEGPLLGGDRQHRVAELFVVHGAVDLVATEAPGSLGPAVSVPTGGVQP